MVIDAEVCDFKKEVVESLSSVFTSEIYTMMIHFIDHLIKDVRRFDTYQFWMYLLMISSTLI